MASNLTIALESVHHLLDRYGIPLTISFSPPLPPAFAEVMLARGDTVRTKKTEVTLNTSLLTKASPRSYVEFHRLEVFMFCSDNVLYAGTGLPGFPLSFFERSLFSWWIFVPLHPSQFVHPVDRTG